MIDLEELKKLALAATPGPWEWWTSNSVLRLTGADGKDGGVICATMHAHWPDIMVNRENREYLAAANPQTVLALIRNNEVQAGFIRDFGEAFGQDKTVQTLKLDLDKAFQDRDEAWKERNRLQDVVGTLQSELAAVRQELEEARKDSGTLPELNAMLKGEIDRINEANKRDAERMRRWDAVRGSKVGIPCACEFEDDGETLKRGCAAHARLRDAENAKLRQELEEARHVLEGIACTDPAKTTAASPRMAAIEFLRRTGAY